MQQDHPKCRQLSAIACAAVLSGCLALSGCSAIGQATSSQTSAASASNASSSSSLNSVVTPNITTTIGCTHNTDEGWIELSTTTSEFEKLGFEAGDSINLVFSSGYTLENVPLYTDSYVREYEPVAVAHKSSEPVVLKLNVGDDLWTVAGLQNEKNPQVTITLKQRAAYIDTQYARNLTYTDNIANYSSKTVFANFRSISGGNLRTNWIYRSASPIDNVRKRASTANALAEAAGVNFFLNLSDSNAGIEGHCEADGFDSQYYASKYKAGCVKAVEMNFNVKEKQFGKKVVAGLVAMSQHEGPYLIHCVEGKDRTGFVCILLEMLAGASLDDIRTDYMASYYSYFGVSQETRSGVYNAIVSLAFDPLAEHIVGAEPKADLSTYDLAACAEKYLLDNGMTEDQLATLKKAILNN